MKTAVVSKPFKGRPDNSPLTLDFVKGDEIHGDLARVAVEELKCAKYKRDSKKKPEKPSQDETLLGSDALPPEIELAEGETVQLGEVVAHAHAESGLSVEDWNGLSDADREEKILADVEAMKADLK